MSDKPAPLGSLLGADQAALEMARKFGALDEEGKLWCIRCDRELGQLPHLCCAKCIAIIRSR